MKSTLYDFHLRCVPKRMIVICWRSPSGGYVDSLFLLPGRSVEELPRVSSSDLQSYRLLYSAVTKDLSDKIATQKHTGGKRTKKGK